ncbi:hypothetical protein [Eubacterium limosum]|uniref:hypothetical protein n=1 Tax=Eubacterium limosum TaxID=1736 RepID=UPI001063A4E1|nr:hypothetical protein [Eubacterium limosum]
MINGRISNDGTRGKRSCCIKIICCKKDFSNIGKTPTDLLNRGVERYSQKTYERKKVMKRKTYKEIEQELNEREKILNQREAQIKEEENRLAKERFELNNFIFETNEQALEINKMMKRLNHHREALEVRENRILEAEQKLYRIPYAV